MQPIVNRSLITAALLLSGCSASYTEPSLDADHPGNPAAMGGPPPRLPRTLDLAAADPVGAGRAGEPMAPAPKPGGTR